MNIKYYFQYLLSYNKVDFHEYDLSQALCYIFDDDFIFEKFKLKDLSLIETCLNAMDYKSEFTTPQLLERLEKGHHLYVVKDQSAIIGYFWIATKEFNIPYFSTKIKLQNHEIYTYNAHVDQKYRGKNLFNQLKAFAFKDLYRQDYKRSIGSYFSWNTASEKANFKFGSVPIGSVRYGHFISVKYFIDSTQSIQLVHHETPLALWYKAIVKIQNKIYKNRF